MSTATKTTSELWAAYHRTRSIADRNALVVYFQPMVRRIAERVYVKLPPEVQLDDLMQLGNQALMQAVTTFDPARKVKFSTFAAFRVRGGIFDGFAHLRDTVTNVYRKG